MYYYDYDKQIMVDLAPARGRPLMGAVCEWCAEPFLTHNWTPRAWCPICCGDSEYQDAVVA